MSRSELPEVLQDLIGNHTPSMDHVAILLDLRSAPETHHSVADVAARTRLDRAVSERVLRELTASRIVSRDGHLYWYAPAADIRATVDSLADMYHTKPVSLVKAIYDRPARAAHSFADAFRIRKAEP
ncbi:MAG: hypothetical protein JWN79_1006 [Gemmatimonadetes bacterium]|nr:hypothetical protein [Gemmatimonadota bacterium]